MQNVFTFPSLEGN